MAEKGYCLKCRASKEMVVVKEVTMKNGRKAIKGKCPDCFTGMHKILGAEERCIEEGVERFMNPRWILVIIIILFISGLAVSSDIAKEKAKQEAGRIIKNSNTLSREKTNDDAIREILFDVSWSEAQKYGSKYEMHVSGYTKDIEALKNYISGYKLYLVDTNSIDFYFYYWPETNNNIFAGKVEVFLVMINGSQFAYGKRVLDNHRIKPFSLYHTLYDSYKKRKQANLPN